MNEKPLSVIIENAKAMLISSFNQVQQKTNLPAYLMEGIILGVLSEVRNQKTLEVIADMNRAAALSAGDPKEEEDNGKPAEADHKN